MAEGFIISDKNYNGEAASYMIQRATIGLDTVEEGCIMVQDGIKYKFTIPRIVVANILQARAATPTSQGTITVDGNILQPLDYSCYTEWNPRDLESYWYAYQLPERLLDATLPQTFEGYLVDTYIKQLNQANEFMIWRGRTAFAPENGGLNPTTKGQDAGDSVYQYYNGLIPILLTDTNTIQVGSPVALTTSNILTTLNTIYGLVPQALINNPNLKFLMNRDTWRIYQQALTANTFKDNQTTDATKMAYKGMQVVALGGMPDNTILCCVATPDTNSALWLGLNSDKDWASVQIAKVMTFSELWGIKILMKAAVQFGFSQEIVLYTTITE